MSQILILCLFAYLCSTTSFAPCKVAFRMDDLQTGWMEPVQKAVVQVFLTANVPLTIGVVTDPILDITTAGGIAEFIKNSLSTGLLELASHSVNHVGFTVLTLAEQTAQ